jgi:hypothetical protein
MPYTIAELSSLERTYLGVLAVGLPPHKLVGDPWLRLDYLTAVAHAGMEGKPAEAHLQGDGPEPVAEFVSALREAIHGLEQKEVLGTSAPSVVFAFDMAPSGPADLSSIDLTATPTIFDTFLAQQCMNVLLGNPQVYAFIMGKYAESSEQWQRLMAEGYGEGPHI